VVTYGEPIHVPPDADQSAITACMKELELELNRITAEADQFFGHEFEV
jgi:hypothetical protein